MCNIFRGGESPVETQRIVYIILYYTLVVWFFIRKKSVGFAGRMGDINMFV